MNIKPTDFKAMIGRRSVLLDRKREFIAMEKRLTKAAATLVSKADADEFQSTIVTVRENITGIDKELEDIFFKTNPLGRILTKLKLDGLAKKLFI